jgi:membrane-bound ClpP family serine protease
MEQKSYYFSKKNYIIMGVGIVLIALGFILMSGGGSDDPNVFNEDIFNSQRLVWAPIIVLSGFVVQVYAIMHTENKQQ